MDTITEIGREAGDEAAIGPPNTGEHVPLVANTAGLAGVATGPASDPPIPDGLAPAPVADPMASVKADAAEERLPRSESQSGGALLGTLSGDREAAADPAGVSPATMKTAPGPTLSTECASDGAHGQADCAPEPTDPAPGRAEIEDDGHESPEPLTGHAAARPRTSRGRKTALAGGQKLVETHRSGAAGDLIAEIRAQWRQRQTWHSAEKRLILQGKALCRRFVASDDDKPEQNKRRGSELFDRIADGGGQPHERAAEIALMPFLSSIETFRQSRARVEKDLEKLAKRLPVAHIVAETRGLGLLSLAGIVGEAGDLGSYKSASALWKRMGLAVIGGGRQMRVKGAAALEQGYSAARRSHMWNVGNGLIGCMGKGPRPLVGEDVSTRDDLSPYQKLFVERLRYEADRDPAAHRREPVESKSGEMRESYSAHAAARAKRYVEKRFLRELRSAWRSAVGVPETIRKSPTSELETRGEPSPARPATAESKSIDPAPAAFLVAAE